MKLRVDPDELAACVACGLCLPHCPTYRVSGEEFRSPRGRIAAMRAVDSGAAEPDAAFARYMNECVQCRGCEPACPSGVPYGRLMEGTRETLAAALPSYVPRWERLMLASLGFHRVVLAGSSLLGVLQRVGVVRPSLSRRLGLPARLDMTRPRLVASGSDVWLHTGCVMDAWLRQVHVAAKRMIESTGTGVALAGSSGSCCGALHVHAGLADQARRHAQRTMASMPGDAPVLVDSAGCGAAMKDYGHLLGTDEAHAFAARVVDIHEWLADRVDDLPPPLSGERPVVAVQDPCHLRHVQRSHLAVRVLLRRYVEVVELDDEGLCCGAGGAYAAKEPGLAGQIRDRKVEAIARSGAPLVASANPGCALHLAAAGVRVAHPVEIAARAAFGAGRRHEPSGSRRRGR